MAGKGRKPENGRNFRKFWDNYGKIRFKTPEPTKVIPDNRIKKKEKECLREMKNYT